jgi:hypothetical protein
LASQALSDRDPSPRLSDDSRTDTSTNPVRTFNGPDLDTLLAEVRREMGSGARIVSATKERSGGVGGFFSKERYSVVAHAAPVAAIKAMQSPQASMTRSSSDTSSLLPSSDPTDALDRLLALADRMSELDGPDDPKISPATTSKPTSSVAPRASTPIRPVPADRLAPLEAPMLKPTRTSHPMGLDDFDLRDDRSTMAPSSTSIFDRAQQLGPVIDLTESDNSSAGAMARPAAPEMDPRQRIREELAPAFETAITHSKSGKRTGRVMPAFGDAPRLSRADVDIASRARRDRAPEAPLDLTDATMTRTAMRHDDLIADRDTVMPMSRDMGPMARSLAPSPVNMPTAPAVVPVAPSGLLPRRSQDGGTVSMPTARSLRPAVSTTSHLQPAARPSLRPAAPVVNRTSTRRRPQRDDVLLSGDHLVQLGMPDHLVPNDNLTSDDLMFMLRDVEVASPMSLAMPGIVALVGDGDDLDMLVDDLRIDAICAAPIARRGTNPWLVVTDPRGVSARCERWNMRREATVITVDGAPTTGDPGWTMAMLDALAPSEIRAVVDADWDMAMVRPWLDALSTVSAAGTVTIELINADGARQPAAVLALGYRIATIDGVPASQQAWLDLLVNRLIGDGEIR